MISMKELQAEERPREKMEMKGPGSLSNLELLAIVLGKGSGKRDVLTLAGDIIDLLDRSRKDVTLKELLNINGIGFSKACQILASLEFSRRFLSGSKMVTINSPEDAIPGLAGLKNADQEEFAVMTLDGSHQVIDIHHITRGLVNQNQIHPRETFYPAIRDRAVSVLLAHNHPSGCLKPSTADLQATAKLVNASKTIGISILDHLIVSRQGFLSIRERHPGYFL